MRSSIAITASTRDWKGHSMDDSMEEGKARKHDADLLTTGFLPMPSSHIYLEPRDHFIIFLAE